MSPLQKCIQFCLICSNHCAQGEDKVDKDERKAAEDRAAQIQREKKAAKKKAAESKTPE